jgi:hypothetical protein
MKKIILCAILFLTATSFLRSQAIDSFNAAKVRAYLGLGTSSTLNVSDFLKPSDISTILSPYQLAGASIPESQVTNLTNDLGLKANLTSPTLVTPIIGVATGTSLAVTGSITSSGTAGIGYATGAGGTVTQATSKSTGVTLNKIAGEITLNSAALASATVVSFTLTNSTIAATDILVLNHVTTGTRGAYTLNAQCAAGSAVIYVRNNTAGSLSEAIVIRFVVIKSVNN